MSRESSARSTLRQALYAEAEAIGEADGEPELSARAWIGYAILAHMRGNYPEARRWYGAAVLIADDNGFREQSFSARQGLMVAAAVAGDFDRAMREGWQAFVLSSGDRDREAEVLTNMAQVLHESGRHDAALRGFAAAVTRTIVPTVLLPALGGAASAAAIVGRRESCRRRRLASRSSWASLGPTRSARLFSISLTPIFVCGTFRQRRRIAFVHGPSQRRIGFTSSPSARTATVRVEIAGNQQRRSVRWPVASLQTLSASMQRPTLPALASS